jgi:sec-independent protein translocase protein TatC
VPSDPDDDDHDKRMSFTEHLGELRIRIIRSAMALGVAVVICYAASNQIFEVLVRPLQSLRPPVVHETGQPALDAEGNPLPAPPVGSTPAPNAPGMIIHNPMEPIIVQIKLAGYGGLVLAWPVIVWQICAFIFPGLLPHERRVVQVIIVGGTVLALAGVGLAYFFVFQMIVPYLMMLLPEGVSPYYLQMSSTVSLLLFGLASFAVAFQFPMIVLILVYMGLIEPATLKNYRKIAIIGIAVVSAVLTPTADPISMCAMMVPLMLMYEASILLSYLIVRRRVKAAAA